MSEQIFLENVRKDFEKIENILPKIEKYRFCILNKSMINEIIDFINENTKNFDKKTYTYQGENYISGIIDRGGFVLGAYDNDELLSLMCVDISIESSKIKNNHNLSLKSLENSVMFDTLIVREGYYSNIINQGLINLCEYLSIKMGYKNAFCTLSPYNYYSVTHCVNSGFYIYSIEDMYIDEESGYEGVKRYLAHMPLGKKRQDVVEQYSVKNTDFKVQNEVLGLGFCGFKTINYKSVDEYFLSYSMMFYD